MRTFNKNQFLTELADEIKIEIENGNITNEDDIKEYVNSSIENACIYYSDCFDIVIELNATEFEGYDFVTAKNISELAFFTLYDFVQEKYDENEAIDLLNKY